MELKYYDKPWLPAFKGAFLILFGMIAMLRIYGSIIFLATLFVILIGMIGFLLITSGILYKKSSFRGLTITAGVINLIFCLITGLKVTSPREVVMSIIQVWVVFYALTEIIEAIMLMTRKNAFFSLFLLNGLLTLLFAYFLHVVAGNFTPQGVFYLGLLASAFGVSDLLSSYLLSRVKIKPE